MRVCVNLEILGIADLIIKVSVFSFFFYYTRSYTLESCIKFVQLSKWFLTRNLYYKFRIKNHFFVLFNLVTQGLTEEAHLVRVSKLQSTLY